MAQAQYDREADALYIRLRDGASTRTVEVDDYRILDLDADQQVLGLEVLYPAANLRIAAIAREWGFDDQLEAIDNAIADALGVAPPTRVTVAVAWSLPFSTPAAPITTNRSRDTTAEYDLVA
jgi:uncharacterized protein YuzE